MAQSTTDTTATARLSTPTSSFPLPSQPSRCFICLGDAGEEGDISDWVHPCPCSLEAHHACLLQWVDECEREGKPLKCPVCRAAIRVEGARDVAVDLADWARGFINGLSPLVLGSMFGGAVVAGQALYGFHAIRVFSGEDAVMRLLGGPALEGRLRQSVPALLGVPMIAPGLIFFQLFPSFASTISTPFSILYSSTFFRHPDALNWPPTPQLAFASLPCMAMGYMKLKQELFGDLERKWDRIIRGLPEAEPNGDNRARNQGIGGGLRDIINGLADGLQGAGQDEVPEGGGIHERVEIWFDEGEGGDEAELVIDLIEEEEDDDDEDMPPLLDIHGNVVEEEDEHDVRAPPVQPEQEQDHEHRPQGHRDQPQQEQQEAQPQAQPQPQPQQPPRQAAAAVERAVRYSLRDLTSTILGALLLPSISWAAGELLRLALPKSWTAHLPPPPRSFLFSSPFRGGPTGLMQERWGRSLVGGCAFVVLKDMFKLYVKYRRAAIRPLRRVPNVKQRTRRE